MVSYGLAYGMEAYGLGQRLNIPTEEAAEILAAYFEAFPNVKAYMDGTVKEARQRGYTETLFGRRRPIPELSSPNYRIRQAGERQAMNAGIQGLAADIFKVALIRLDRALEDGGFASRLILQVHDEVLVEVAPGEHDVAAELTLDRHRRCRRPARPARGEPRLRPHLGRREGLSVRWPTRTPPTTGSSRWPSTSAPPTCATRSPRAPCRRSTRWSRCSRSNLGCGCSTSAAGRAGTSTSWPAAAHLAHGIDISRALRRARDRAVRPPVRRSSGWTPVP